MRGDVIEASADRGNSNVCGQNTWGFDLDHVYRDTVIRDFFTKFIPRSLRPYVDQMALIIAPVIVDRNIL